MTITVDRPISVVEADLIRETVPLAAGVRLGYIAFDVTATDGPGGFDNEAGTGTDPGAFVGLI